MRKVKLIIFIVMITITCYCSAEEYLPKGKFLFQPMLIWGDSETSFQGTGFIIEDMKGNVFGITSAHYVDFYDAGVFEMIWLDIPTYRVVHGFKECLGHPRPCLGINYSKMWFDFIVLPAEEKFQDYTRLKIDDRTRLKPGEEILFPNKDFNSDTGYNWIDAILVWDYGGYLTIEMKKEIELQSQSGSPVLSKVTGKVVGIVSGSYNYEGKQYFHLSPGREILKYMANNDKRYPLLKSTKLKEGQTVIDDKPSSSQLINNGDGTVTDKVTGLMWTYKDSYADLGKCLDWNDSKLYVKKLRTGGFRDWRLPSVSELQTICNLNFMETNQFSDKTPLHISPAFASKGSWSYWTNEQIGSCCACDVNFEDCCIGKEDKSMCMFQGIRAVRDPE